MPALLGPLVAAHNKELRCGWSALLRRRARSAQRASDHKVTSGRKRFRGSSIFVRSSSVPVFSSLRQRGGRDHNVLRVRRRADAVSTRRLEAGSRRAAEQAISQRRLSAAATSRVPGVSLGSHLDPV